ncbi:HNH endonuclease [Vibrio splendidus]|uniref:HNH endonuclease n=1 Tax=Vibrio splendidus TaxID=29497 RepID=UPI00246822EF|nr:HNH endonuclease signature motif containing protein [Vibrio splendidus]MDH6016129.1 HNH endonuclease [Vibrio splendidus]
MWSLSLPENENHKDIISKALTYLNGTAKYELTEEEYVVIDAAYERYEELKGKPHDDLLTNTLTDDTKDALYEGYNEIQENKRLKDYRSRLLLSAERCPCCSIGDADELDHHLPRSVYKALALYSSNLVPMCHKCNNKKRTAAGSLPTDRFLHVYYDQVPTNERFFIANVNISNNEMSISFEVENIESLDDDLYKMMTFQSTRVNLDSRLMKEVNIFLMPFYVSMEALFDATSDPELIKQLLLKGEGKFNKKMGINDWRSSLLFSLANNYEFCNGGFKFVLSGSESG